jgi:pimeloyl-ACP methyl ester carboxylesterase
VSGLAAQPFWIETAGGALFAWHHAPAAGLCREAAVILCRPFGYDAQCSQRAYRHLAQRLSAAGFHVVRFDYHGTGDSSGGDADGDRVAAWVGSIHAAIDWVQANVGIDKIALFGSRFGALMAMQAAGGADVDSIAAFAPPASGRAWLREARAFQAMVDAAGNLTKATSSDNHEESAGFLIARPTVEAIGKLDPLSLDHRARAVLLIARDDLPGAEEKLASKLTERGVAVTLTRTPGYGAMMSQDPQRSVVPDAVWAEIVGWLSARYALAADSPALVAYSRVANVREQAHAATVREEALDMGGLFGVVTEPTEIPEGDALPTIVLHNIGVNSHIGANRIYVNMARRWAALGFRVLRFDTAGLGDSPANERVAENCVYSKGATDDSRRAMDFLASTRGSRRFVLMGLCSGAYVSFHAAVADARVAGIVLMNILLFHWKEGDPVDVRKRDVVKSVRFYWREAFGREVWRRLVKGEINVSAIAQGLLQKGVEHARQKVSRAVAGESDVALGFRAMLKRGTDVLLVYAGDDGGRDVIDTHLGTNAERFRHESAFRFEVIEQTDHTFSPLRSQEILGTMLTGHLVDRFAAKRSSGSFVARGPLMSAEAGVSPRSASQGSTPARLTRS